jgi:hypothetical protein
MATIVLVLVMGGVGGYFYLQLRGDDEGPTSHATSERRTAPVEVEGTSVERPAERERRRAEADREYHAELERACRSETPAVWDPRWEAAGKDRDDLASDLDLCLRFTWATQYGIAVNEACRRPTGAATFDERWRSGGMSPETMAADVARCRGRGGAR